VIEEVDIGCNVDRTAIEIETQLDPRFFRVAPNVGATSG
jgi:hypothetical protein